jgi:glycine oxidase
MNPDIIILGGGIIGQAIALELVLNSKLQVVIYDRGRQGGEASWAAAGMLGAQAEALTASKLWELCLASRELFPDFITQVEMFSKASAGYYPTGTMVIALTDDELSTLAAQYEWQQAMGLAVEKLTKPQIQELFPMVTPTTIGGYYLPNEHQVDNRQLMQQLRVALVGRIATYTTKVIRLLTMSNKVIGVETSSGKHYAGMVVNTLGSWANQVDEPNVVTLPTITPIRGQMVAVTGISLPRPVIRWLNTYLVPRPEQRLVIGSTAENVGYAAQITVAGIQDLLTRAGQIIPSLSQAALLESWAGLRPQTPDGWPILGPHPYWEQLILAIGHYRHGILLAPITAKLIGALIMQSSTIDPAFSLRRFDATRSGTH